MNFSTKSPYFLILTVILFILSATPSPALVFDEIMSVGNNQLIYTVILDESIPFENVKANFKTECGKLLSYEIDALSPECQKRTETPIFETKSVPSLADSKVMVEHTIPAGLDVKFEPIIGFCKPETLPAGKNTIRITIEAESEKCENNYFEILIDAVPTIKDENGVINEKTEWAWLNTSFTHKILLNCTKIRNNCWGFLNGTNKMKIGSSVNQVLAGVCQGSTTSIYWQNASLYILGNDTTQLPLDVIKGLGRDYKAKNVYNNTCGDTVKAVFFPPNRKDVINNLSWTIAGTTNSTNSILGSNSSYFDGAGDRFTSPQNMTNYNNMAWWVLFNANAGIAAYDGIIATLNKNIYLTPEASKFLRFHPATCGVTLAGAINTGKWLSGWGIYNQVGGTETSAANTSLNTEACASGTYGDYTCVGDYCSAGAGGTSFEGYIAAFIEFDNAPNATTINKTSYNLQNINGYFNSYNIENYTTGGVVYDLDLGLQPINNSVLINAFVINYSMWISSTNTSVLNCTIYNNLANTTTLHTGAEFINNTNMTFNELMPLYSYSTGNVWACCWFNTTQQNCTANKTLILRNNNPVAVGTFLTENLMLFILILLWIIFLFIGEAASESGWSIIVKFIAFGLGFAVIFLLNQQFDLPTIAFISLFLGQTFYLVRIFLLMIL